MWASVEQLVGTKVGKYRLTQLIGQGKLSVVYIAQNLLTGQSDMLTFFLLPEGCTGHARERFMLRFEQLAEALISLRHPHIVAVYDYGQHEQNPYLVNPLIEGESLTALLQMQGRCTPEQTMGFLWQIADGLDHAHKQGFVHGSLKPSNILLVEQAGQRSIQIAGFGLTQMLELRGIGQVVHPYPHLFSVAGTYLTSPAYFAPELVQGAPADERSDVYALGILLFEMLCGRPPFVGDDPIQVARQHVEQRMPSLQMFAPELSSALDIALQRALEREPLHRISSAGKLVTSFERVMDVMQRADRQVAPVQWQRDEEKISWMGMPGVTVAKMPSISPSFQGLPTGKIETVSGKSEGYSQFRLQGIAKPKVMSINPNVKQKPMVEQIPLESHADEDLLSRWSVSAQMPAVPLSEVPNGVKTTEGILPARQMRPVRGTQPLPTPTAGRMNAMATGQQAIPSSGVMRITLKQPAVATPKKEELKVQGRRNVLQATGCLLAAGLLLGGGGAGAYYALQRLGAAEQTKSVASPPTVDENMIGDTRLENNAAEEFVHPLTKRPGLLVHLENGNFVAYDGTCTHEDSPVVYDPETKKIVCPRHKSSFDPEKNGAVVKGPATKALLRVAIHVQTDGSIVVK